MKEFDIKAIREEAKRIPQEAKDAFTRNLMCAVLYRAVEDYVNGCSKRVVATLPRYYFDKATIIKDLKDERTVTLSDGMSLTVAHALKTNPEKIKINLAAIADEYSLARVDKYDKPVYK